jgi:FMN phosphatase YigB (HAD superfamily)
MRHHWQSVIFVDLDNTIIEGFDSEVFPRILGELSEKSGQGLDEVRHLVLKENRDRQRNPDIPATHAMDWDDIIDTVAERLGVQLERSAWEVFKAYAGPPYSEVLDNAYTVLQELRCPHRAIVAATKGLSKYQITVLNALNLTPLFDGILTPDSNGALKKDAAFYGRWPELADLKIFVGDHYEDDVLAPSQSGFKTVWKPPRIQNNGAELSPFDRPKEYSYPNGHSVYPDAIILSLQELPEVITKLERENLPIPQESPERYFGQIWGQMPVIVWAHTPVSVD